MLGLMKKNSSWDTELAAMAERARAAAHALGHAPAEARTQLLKAAAQKLLANKDAILAANARDVKNAENRLSKAMADRLTLNPARIEAMARGLEAVAAQPD